MGGFVLQRFGDEEIFNNRVGDVDTRGNCGADQHDLQRDHTPELGH